MNKTAKIIITVLSILLIASIALNVSYLTSNSSEKRTAVKENAGISEDPAANETGRDTLKIEKDSIQNEQN